MDNKIFTGYFTKCIVLFKTAYMATEALQTCQVKICSEEEGLDGGIESSLSLLEEKLNLMWDLFLNDDKTVAWHAGVWKNNLST